MSFEPLFLLCGGIAFLTVGGEFLVRGASRLAALWGVSPLVIGLTVVAFGTSSPEMAVSVESAYSGQGDIALGNVVGSNIFNVLLILVVCAESHRFGSPNNFFGWMCPLWSALPCFFS